VYFDATDIFLEESDSHAGVEGMYIPRSLMGDYLHPTAEGYRRWGESMVEAIHEITDASKSKMGRKPLPHRQGGKGGKR
jgi:lysophospholipase L1-like esterase